jgi:uncharacterized short protein YbdD (DUF466 family)
MPGRPEGTTAGRARLRDALAALLATIRGVAGMPNHAAYLEHLRRCHPERALPTERELYEAYLRSRYPDGSSRCC